MLLTDLQNLSSITRLMADQAELAASEFAHRRPGPALDAINAMIVDLPSVKELAEKLLPHLERLDARHARRECGAMETMR